MKYQIFVGGMALMGDNIASDYDKVEKCAFGIVCKVYLQYSCSCINYSCILLSYVLLFCTISIVQTTINSTPINNMASDLFVLSLV